MTMIVTTGIPEEKFNKFYELFKLTDGRFLGNCFVNPFTKTCWVNYEISVEDSNWLDVATYDFRYKEIETPWYKKLYRKIKGRLV
jgi:hypothetical protein